VVVIAASSSDKGHLYPPEIIACCVWLYQQFPLSFREVEELMLQRGVVVSYETIRQWCAKFGQVYANRLRRRRARPGDKWHLDEVFIRINGTIHDLWRAVDQHGIVLDVLVRSRRNALAAKKFFRKLPKRQCASPRCWSPTYVADWDNPADPTTRRYFRGTKRVIDRADDPYRRHRSRGLGHSDAGRSGLSARRCH
jgi:transposase-like protein